MCQKKIMRKRSSDHLPEGPPKKRISPGGNILPVSIVPGEILTDLTGKQWKLGNSIGCGGFGEIYPASDNLNQTVKNDAPYVIKVESHTNGPLFVEIHCLLRIGRIDMINEWKSEHNIESLGMIHYIASGSHVVNEEKIRFLVVPRYEQDLEKTFIAKQKKFNIKTVILICTQILDVLEYIHSKGYVHCDIKASNILHSLQKNSPNINKLKQKENKPDKIIHRDWNPIRRCRFKQSGSHGRNLRPKRVVNYVERNSDNENSKPANVEKVISPTVTDTKNPNQVYLIDYGLATKYRHPDGRHKQYCNDERKAHAGTIQFCSLDAHLGATSRRSDLESLGYNLLYWLTSNLPWTDLNNPEAVQKKKEEFFNNLEIFLNTSIQEYPTFLYKYFEYVKSLTFESKPDYALCKKLFLSALQEYEYKNDGCLDFNNVEGWGRKPHKEKTMSVHTNRRTRRTKRTPLATKNAPSDKPVLRKNKKSQKRKLNWSNILSDPEEILRQNNKQNKSQETVKSRERKLTESSDTSCVGNSVHNLDIWTLNPTYAMLEVFNKCRDKNASCYNGPVKNGKGDGLSLEHRDGYTPAMDMILTKICQRRTEELENETDNYRNRYMTRTRSFRNNTKKTNSIKKGTKSSTSITKKIERKPKPITRSLRGYGFRG